MSTQTSKVAILRRKHDTPTPIPIPAPVNRSLDTALHHKIDGNSKPLGALGRLEDLA